MDRYNYETVDYISSDSELESDTNSEADTNSEPDTNKFNKINTNVYTQNVLLDSSSAITSEGNLIFDFINSGNSNTNTTNGGVFGRFKNVIGINLVRADIKNRYFNINSTNNKLFFECNNIKYLLEIPINRYNIDNLIDECNNISNYFNLNTDEQLKFINSIPFNLIYYGNKFYFRNGIYGTINIDNINSTLNTILGIDRENGRIINIENSIGYGTELDPSKTIGAHLDYTSWEQLKTSSRIFNGNDNFDISIGKLYILDQTNKGYTMLQLNNNKFNANALYGQDTKMYITIDNIYVVQIDFSNINKSINEFKQIMKTSSELLQYADITIDNDNNIIITSKMTKFNSINYNKNIKIHTESITGDNLLISASSTKYLTTYMKVVVHNIHSLNDDYYYILLDQNNNHVSLYVDAKLDNIVNLSNIEYTNEIFLTRYNNPNSSIHIHTNKDEINTTLSIYELLKNISRHDGIIINKNHFKDWMIITNSSENSHVFDKMGIIRDYNMFDGEINVKWNKGIYDNNNIFNLTNNQTPFVIYPSCTFELQDISNVITSLTDNEVHNLILMRTNGRDPSIPFTEYFKIPFSSESNISNEETFVNYVKDYLSEDERLFIRLNEFTITKISVGDNNNYVFQIDAFKQLFKDGSKVYFKNMNDINGQLIPETTAFYVKNIEDSVDEIELYNDIQFIEQINEGDSAINFTTGQVSILDNPPKITNKTITIETRIHSDGIILTIVPYIDISNISDDDFSNRMYLKQGENNSTGPPLFSDNNVYKMIKNTHLYGGKKNVNISKISSVSNNVHIQLDFNSVILNGSNILIDGVNGYIPPSTYTGNSALTYESATPFPIMVYSIQITDPGNNYYKGWKLYASNSPLSDDSDVHDSSEFKGIVMSSIQDSGQNSGNHKLTVLSSAQVSAGTTENFTNVKLVPYKLNGNTFNLIKYGIHVNNSYQLNIPFEENGLQTHPDETRDMEFNSSGYILTNITDNSDTGYIISRPNHTGHNNEGNIHTANIKELIENPLYQYQTIPGYIKGITKPLGQYVLMPPFKYSSKLDTLYIDIVIDEIPHVSCKLNLRGDKILERIPNIQYEGDMVSYISSTSKKINYNLPISIDTLSVKLLDDMGNMYFIDESNNFSIELKLTMIKDYDDLLNNIT